MQNKNAYGASSQQTTEGGVTELMTFAATNTFSLNEKQVGKFPQLFSRAQCLQLADKYAGYGSEEANPKTKLAFKTFFRLCVSYCLDKRTAGL